MGVGSSEKGKKGGNKRKEKIQYHRKERSNLIQIRTKTQGSFYASKRAIKQAIVGTLSDFLYKQIGLELYPLLESQLLCSQVVHLPNANDTKS